MNKLKKKAKTKPLRSAKSVQGISQGVIEKGTPKHTRKLISIVKKEFNPRGPAVIRPEAFLPGDEIKDPLDLASYETTRELILLLTARKKEKREAIEEALEKAKKGTYGICEECGNKIERARLKAMPLAKFCISCQEDVEKEGRSQQAEEETLPFHASLNEEDLD